MFGVGGNLQGRFGRGAKEHAVNNPLVLEGHGRDHLSKYGSRALAEFRREAGPDAGGAYQIPVCPNHSPQSPLPLAMPGSSG
jgi:hypothetical protein